MQITMMVERDAEGGTCETVAFDGEATDLAIATAVLLANVSDHMTVLAGRFAAKSIEALEEDDGLED
jgi:hypothetical protein